MNCQKSSRRMQYVIQFDALNLQDAIDFAVFTFGQRSTAQRLTNGTIGSSEGSWPGVGGPIRIAVAYPNGTVEWVQRTALQGGATCGTSSRRLSGVTSRWHSSVAWDVRVPRSRSS